MTRLFGLRPERLLWCVPLACSLFACSSQVQSDYQGEPVATLRGKVVAKKASLESDVNAAIVWNTVDPRYLGERIDVSGGFPASFTLSLYEPPPREADIVTMVPYCIAGERIDIPDGDECASGQLVPKGTSLGFSYGYVAAIDADVPDGEIERTDIRGVDVEHFVIHFDHDAESDEELPANPSAEQLARKHQLVSVDYVGPRTAGYHLGKINPAKKAFLKEVRECKWRDLCVHWTFPPELQDKADWEFEQCTARYPENPTCDAFRLDLAEGEPASSSACRERYEAFENDCRFATAEMDAIANPDGLDDPVTIELGSSYWDVAQ